MMLSYMGSNFMQQLKSELTQVIPDALANFDQLPDSAYIRLPVMIGLYGVSAASIWRGTKQGIIPKAIKLTKRTTAWNVGQVRAALAAKAV